MALGRLETAFKQFMQFYQKNKTFTINNLLTVFEPIFADIGIRNETNESNIPNARNILVIRLDEIGDFILTSSFLRELRRLYPEAVIMLLVKPNVKNIAEYCPYVNEVITIDIANIYNKQRMTGVFKEVYELCRLKLWKIRLDMAIVPRYDFDNRFASVIAYLSGATTRIGYSEKATRLKAQINRGHNRLFTHTLTSDITHEVVLNLKIIAYLGGHDFNTKLEMWLHPEDEKFAKSALSRIKGSKVALSPGLSSSRYWPLERIIEVSKWLVQQYGAKIVILGSREEEASGQNIQKELRENAIDFSGKTTLRQCAALLKECTFYLGRDTSIMHMAAAVNVPVVECSSHPSDGYPDDVTSTVRFRPWGVPHVIIRPRSCVPPCKNYCQQNVPHCILEVTIEKVKNAIITMIQKGSIQMCKLQSTFVEQNED